MSVIHTGSGKVTYKAVRKAMGRQPYSMSLTDTEEIRAVVLAVNQGIDSHLEACLCPDLGDSYGDGARTLSDGRVLCGCLDCVVSVESLPVLLRRLCELDTAEDTADAGMTLAGDILMTLGFDEYGKFVGREALGLD
jgi:hypothetical protein